MNIEGEHFYIASLYDFAILHQRFLESDTHLMQFQNAIPVRDAAGNIIDHFRDTVHFAALINIVQLSFAFLEKSLKYVLSTHSKPGSLGRIRNFNHSLRDLIAAVDTVDTFRKDMPPNALAALMNIESISFKDIRYLDKPQKFKIRPLQLKELLDYTHKRVQDLRLKLYSAPILAKQAIARSHIQVFVPAPISAPPRISSGLLDDLANSAKLTDTESAFARSAYGDPDAEDYRLLKFASGPEYTELVRIVVKSELFAFWGHEFQFEIK